MRSGRARGAISAAQRAAVVVLAVGALLAAARPAAAAPRRDRVVLADPDPELLRAVTSALAPWRLEVIVDDDAPAGPDDAEARAEARDARFVVWRREGALLVFDRERGVTDERAGDTGPLDPVAAASAALTVKTLMRLPPLPDADRDGGGGGLGGGGDSGGGAGTGLGLRVQAQLALRVARGADTDAGGRVAALVMLRPRAGSGWRVGAAGELGTAATVERAGFKGTWRDWAALGVASWTHTRRRWELEPLAGAGLASATLDGDEGAEPRRERATLGVLRGGLALRRRTGRWTLGGALTADVFLGTPTYTKIGSPARIFEVPAGAISLGILAAADLGGAL